VQIPFGLSSSKPISKNSEIIAGLTLAAIGIPEVIGYSTIAGMPELTGIMTMIIPIVLYAIFGASRHLVVGADSATAALLAAGLTPIAIPESSHYVALAGLVAVMTAGWLLLARVLKLGFVASFLSSTLLVGFLTGVGVSVAVSQLPKMLGLDVHAEGSINTLIAVLSHIRQIALVPLVVSVVCVLAMVLTKRFHSLPTPLLLLGSSMVLCANWTVVATHLSLVRMAEGHLLQLGWPHVHLSEWSRLVSLSLSLALVVLAQSAATGRSFARKYGENYNANRDLTALALANIGAALSGAYVVNGSPTKTEIVDEAGSRTQWAALVTAGVGIFSLFLLRKPLAHLPEAVLSAVVFTIGLSLMRFSALREIRQRRRDEWVVALATAVAVVAFGVEIGIVIAMAIALINHVRRGYDPRNYLMHKDEDGAWIAGSVAERVQIEPGVFLYRFQASLYYANVEKFSREILELAQLSTTLGIIVDASAIADVDYSAGQEVLVVARRLADLGIELVFTHAVDHVVEQFDDFGISAAPNVSYEIHTQSALLRYRNS
jgi:hypothetical protein